MATARWYNAHPKGGGANVYTRKCEDGKVAVLSFAGNRYTAVQHLTPEQARDRYTVGDVLDALTHTNAELNYRRLTQPASKPAPTPPTNCNGKTTPLTGAAKEVEGKTTVATEAGVAGRPRADYKVGVDGVEARVNRLKAVSDDVSTSAFWMLIYDIPQCLASECPNPSHLLWHYGFRLNLSCWVLPQKPDQHVGVDHHQVQGLLSHWSGFPTVKTFLIRYHDDEVGKIRDIARSKLEEEVRRIHTSLIERLGSASDRLRDARKELEQGEAEHPGTATSHDFERLDARCDNQQRAIIKGAGEDLQAAIDCARLFDETENLADLLDGLRKAIRSEAQSFNAHMRAKGGKPVSVKL